MSDLADCIQRAVDAGEVDAARARAAQEKYRDLVTRYGSDGTPDAVARRMAADDVMESITAETQRRRHTVLAQMRDIARAQRDYAGRTAQDPDQLLRQLDQTERERLGLEQRYMSRIRDFLAQTRTRITGTTRDRAMVEDVVRELHGQSSGRATARELAEAIGTVQEQMRQHFNMLGGDIGQLQNRGVRHAHNARAIQEAGFDRWVRAIYDELDWHRITDFDTGKPFTSAPGGRPNRTAAERFLRDVHDGITSGGWSRREPGMQMGGAALYNRRKEHRVLHFRDGDAWLRYNEQFGEANPLDALLGEIRGMARDIALMRNFGPNPRLGVELRSQIMAKDASGEAGAQMVSDIGGVFRAGTTRRLNEVVDRKNRKARVMLRHLTGEANVPADRMAGYFFAGTRNLLTGAQLGSSSLVQVSDLATMRLAASSISMNPNAPMQNAMRMMTSRVSRQEAADLGFIFDTWFHAGAAQARMVGDIWAPEWTHRVTNFVLRTNGLAYLTDHSRTALRYTFATELGEMAGRGFGDLPAPLQNFLQGRGISAADWDHLRAPGALYTLPSGGKAISPAWFAEHTNLPRLQAEDLASRFSRAVEEFTELGVPTTSLRGRATLGGDLPPGSFGGELLRSTLMYKSFTLSLMFNHMRRVMELRDMGTRAQYVGTLMAYMTVMGVLAVQLKELARGRDPRPMDRWQTWAAGAAQGGGIGIFGDFFAATVSRAGGGLHEVAGGPLVGLGSDLGRAVSSNVARAAEGRDSLIGRDAVNLARRYNPLATHVGVRTALDRLLWDQLQDILDPEARTQWRRWERQMQRDYGTRSWWRRGQPAPDRAPDPGNIMGAQR